MFYLLLAFQKNCRFSQHRQQSGIGFRTARDRSELLELIPPQRKPGLVLDHIESVHVAVKHSHWVFSLDGVYAMGSSCIHIPQIKNNHWLVVLTILINMKVNGKEGLYIMDNLKPPARPNFWHLLACSEVLKAQAQKAQQWHCRLSELGRSLTPYARAPLLGLPMARKLINGYHHQPWMSNLATWPPAWPPAWPKWAAALANHRNREGQVRFLPPEMALQQAISDAFSVGLFDVCKSRSDHRVQYHQ